MLLCHCINRGHSSPAISGWANGVDGRRWYQQTKGRLHGSTSAEQVGLTVTALLSYKWFAGLGGRTPAVISYSYLHDFVWKLMAGTELQTRREAWMCMARSIQEFLGKGYMPPSFTDGAFTEEPRQWPHGLVEMCRICAGDNSCVLGGQEHLRLEPEDAM